MTENGPWRNAAERREAMQATVTRTTLAIKDEVELAKGFIADIRFDDLPMIATRLDIIVFSLWALFGFLGVHVWKHWR